MQDLFGTDNTEEPVPNKKPDKEKTETGPIPEPKSFEAAMVELEELVGSLEGGRLPIDESVEVYRKARELAVWCYDRLNNIHGELKKLGLDEKDGFALEDLPPVE